MIFCYDGFPNSSVQVGTSYYSCLVALDFALLSLNCTLVHLVFSSMENPLDKGSDNGK